MTLMYTHMVQALRSHFHPRPADVLAIVAAILSLLTFTVLLPSGLHLP